MIVESDKQSGSARKQYIGMVTMLDVVAHCPEGLSLWSLNPNTRLLILKIATYIYTLLCFIMSHSKQCFCKT